jgi:hypothetical protein
MQFLSFANGWKTYFICAAGLLTGIVQGLEATHVVAFHIPGAVDWVLVFLGGATLRHGVQTRSAQITEEIVELVQLILPSITTFSANSTWTKPAGAKSATVIVQASPAGQTDAQERTETAALNRSQT